MDRFIFLNDRIVPLEEARLSPGQMGLLMGWGVFTTLRIYEGFPFAFDRHWARLSHDAERLAIPLPYEREKVEEAIVKLAQANRRAEGMGRLCLVKNRGGLWADAPAHPPTELLVFTRELVAWPAAHRLKLEPDSLYSGSRLAGAKMISWVQNAATLERVHQEGFDDALLMNERGHLVECTSANIFLIRERRVLTPPLSSGCLPGITREVLKEVIPQAGLTLEEKDLAPADLSTTEEVFISSTTREVAGVGSISSPPPAQASWNYQAPGRVTQRLEKAFRQYVKTQLPRTSL
jgi:branched-chain amino acid aminotransferase